MASIPAFPLQQFRDISQKRRITADDVLALKAVSDAQVSPDGEQVAFVLGDGFKVDSADHKSQICLVSTQDKNLRTLTRGTRTDSLPRWSPDGESLAFASDRLEDGQKQIYLLSIDGGEARKLTDIRGSIPTPRGLNSLQWSPDGKWLAFLKENEETPEEKVRKQQKDDAIEFEKHPRYVRIWTVDVDSGEVRCVSPDRLQIWEFAWASDSQHFAATVSDHPFEWAWYRNRLVRFPVARGTVQLLHQSRRQVALPRWSPDGRFVAFLSSFWSDRGVTAGDILIVPALGGTVQNLTEGVEASYGWMEWKTDSRSLLGIVHQNGQIGLHSVQIAGRPPEVIWHEDAVVAEHFWPRFSISRGTRVSDEHTPARVTVAVVKEDAQQPRDVWTAQVEEGSEVRWQQLTDLHPQASQFELGRTESITWKGSGGLEMQGLLVYPVNHQPGTRVPLVTWVHGGPTSAANFRYANDAYTQLIAARGIAVFLPNYRGSVGRGVTFAESNTGDLGGADLQDILLGVDFCIHLGIADAERLGIGGWSYGGFMTAWAVTQTQRFKAAVMGAGISNWTSFHGNSILCDWDALHLNASPFEEDGIYRQRSPITFVSRVTTPTLILHGEKDEDVPVEQSYQFFRALKDQQVTTELVVYPREAHGPGEKLHLRDLMHRIPGWFERYLKS